MSITQQYLLDTYRARRLGEPAPPAPGADDWQVVRELRDQWQLRAAVAGRPAHGRVRRTGRVRRSLGRWLGRRPRSMC